MLIARHKTRPPNEAAFNQFKNGKFRHKSSIAIVAQAVASELKMSVLDIKSRTRKREIVEARQITMYFAMKKGLGTLQRVGGYFDKDHATCLYSVRTVENLMETNRDFANLVSRIERKL